MTIIELPPEKYELVREMYEPLHHYMFAQGVLDGNYEGRIYVDSINSPRSAFLITRDIWGYWGGDPETKPFLESFRKDILPDRIGGGGWGLLMGAPEGEIWDEAMTEVIAPRELIIMKRRLYTASGIDDKWVSAIPDGYEIQWIDEALLSDIEGDVPDDVRGVLNRRIPGEEPERRGFGYAAIRDRKIVSHAVIDAISGDRGEIGLETHEDHQRLGLAAGCSVAAIEYGLTHGLQTIFWDTNEDNIASQKTAERLGLKLSNHHRMFLFVFDIDRHEEFYKQFAEEEV